MALIPQRRALLIAGPTASGKSAVALKVARQRGGVIINADALQVYAELRILSARPTPEEERLAPHRLYGHVPGASSYSVGQWLADATREIDAAWGAGLLPIVVGGTGLYFRALEQGLAVLPLIPPEVRERWRRFTGDLSTELAARDPEAAARLGPSDRQRIIRALEVIEGTGHSLAHWHRVGQSQAVLAGAEVEHLFLDVGREELYARAEARFEAMLAEGALAEVGNLPPLDPALPVMKAIGVPELLRHLRGEISLEQATALAEQATRNYIKRQLTWWRGQMKHWRVAATP
jgi:tRNA dimethylallyltransferase